MRFNPWFCWLFLLLAFLLPACNIAPGPAETMTKYFQALAAKDANRLAILACAEWATQSQELLDSFTAVELKLTNLNCQETENNGQTAAVKCSGKLVATYFSENQEIDLSINTYTLVKQNQEWLVCGQK